MNSPKYRNKLLVGIAMSDKNSKIIKENRDVFSSKVGFIIACIGSAVGMGNIWMFPYRVGQFGCAAFLIPYLLFVILLGCTGLMGEFAFGRMSKTGPIGSFKIVMESKNKIGVQNDTFWKRICHTVLYICTICINYIFDL